MNGLNHGVNYTAETLALMRDSLGKNITISTGLTAYDLQAPAKNLYPTITPIRNTLPRVQRANPGDAARWRSIMSIVGSGFNAMGWVPEGQRSASMSYAATPVSASYVTLGEEDTVSFEAESAAVGFEDVNATASMRLLQKTMRKEEQALVGGNATVALGTPTAPTLSASGTGFTLPTLTYSVIVVALTYEGYQNSSLSSGVATSKTITGNDSLTYVLNGGSSNKSAATTQAVTLGAALFASTPVINGAVAYAWFTGAAGSETLQAITTINSVSFTAPLIGSQQAATLITADASTNSLAFNGLLSTAFANANAASPAYVAYMATGTAGTGSFLTASGRGSVMEIDNMLLQMWNQSRLSPTVIYVNAQEQKNITNKVLTNASGPLLRYDAPANGEGGGYNIHASGVVRFYFNPYSVDGGKDIPIMVHPDLPPGTILAWCDRLPVWYQSNEVPNVAEVLTRRDYYRIDWPLRTRRREYGVYTEEVLAVYAPFAVGILTNIGNG